MPFKNNSTVAQYVIDSFNIVELGSGVYTSLTSYITLFTHTRLTVVLQLRGGVLYSRRAKALNARNYFVVPFAFVRLRLNSV